MRVTAASRPVRERSSAISTVYLARARRGPWMAHGPSHVMARGTWRAGGALRTCSHLSFGDAAMKVGAARGWAPTIGAHWRAAIKDYGYFLRGILRQHVSVARLGERRGWAATVWWVAQKEERLFSGPSVQCEKERFFVCFQRARGGGACGLMFLRSRRAVERAPPPPLFF